MSDNTEKENLPLQGGKKDKPKKKGRNYKRIALQLLIDLVIVSLVLTAVFWWQTRALVPTGYPAPDFSLQLYQPDNPSPKIVTLKDLAGKQTVLAFWAPWCSVCRAEVSTINSLKRILGDDANVYTVVLDYSSFSQVQDFIDENELQAPVLLGTPEVASNYSIGSFPTVYMLDAEGKVINHTVGYSTQMGIRARLWAAELF